MKSLACSLRPLAGLKHTHGLSTALQVEKPWTTRNQAVPLNIDPHDSFLDTPRQAALSHLLKPDEIIGSLPTTLGLPSVPIEKFKRADLKHTRPLYCAAGGETLEDDQKSGRPFEHRST